MIEPTQTPSSRNYCREDGAFSWKDVPNNIHHAATTEHCAQEAVHIVAEKCGGGCISKIIIACKEAPIFRAMKGMQLLVDKFPRRIGSLQPTALVR